VVTFASIELPIQAELGPLLAQSGHWFCVNI